MAEGYPTFVNRSAQSNELPSPTSLRKKVISLTAARTKEEIPIRGSFIWAISSSSSSANIDVWFNSQDGDPFNFQSGLSIGGLPYYRLFISNTAQAGESLTIFTFQENPIGDFRVNNNTQSGSVVANLTGFDGTNWDNLVSSGDDSSIVTPVSSGILRTTSTIMAINDSSKLTRLHSFANDSDSITPENSTNSLGTVSFNMAWNGVGYQRISQNFSLNNYRKTVTASSSSILAAETTRRYLLIQNIDSANAIYLNVSGIAATTNDFRLGAFESIEFRICPLDEIFMIADVNPTKVILITDQ